MPDASLIGTLPSSESKLDSLRERVHQSRFQDADDLRQFINQYVSSNPQESLNESYAAIEDVVASVRADLGLTDTVQPGTSQIIPEHVRDLVQGRAQASEDTAHYAVHHAANQVTMHSGQFVYEGTHVFIDGAGMDLAFHCTYKSQGFHNGPIGINWDHNYNLKVRVLDGGQKIVRLTGGFQESSYVKHKRYGLPDSNGRLAYNYWAPSPGDHDVLLDLNDAQEFGIVIPPDCTSCQYAVRTAGGLLYYYEQEGLSFPDRFRVKRIENRTGNYLAFSYTQLTGTTMSVLEKIDINSPARFVIFESDSRGRIVRIKDYIGRIWCYFYDDFGDLISFLTPKTDRYPEGLTEHFAYSTTTHTGELQHNMTHVYDTAGRLYLENEYGTDSGLLSFNRVVRQREGNGERFFEYEDVSLATGLPLGLPDIEEDMPTHQTVMVRRNGHPVHYIYNKFGNMIAREEDAWASGTRRRLITHYCYNRDGALIGEISPEGRITQYLYGRDVFILGAGLAGLSENDLFQNSALTWQQRLAFGNRLAIIKRAVTMPVFVMFQFPNPLPTLGAIDTRDITVKFTYEPNYQNITTVSDPRYTNSPWPNAVGDNNANNPDYERTLTKLQYDQPSSKLLKQISYPACTRDGQLEISVSQEKFVAYNGRGRLTDYEDQVGTSTRFIYYPATQNPNNTDSPREGYLWKQIIDPANPQSNPGGLDLDTSYDVNNVGVVSRITTPKRQEIEFDIDNLNRVTKATRMLKPGIGYETRYMYCRNMRVEQIERDVHDEEGQRLWGGTEVQFFHYDENDNVVREQRGSLDFDDHFVTRHTFDDGDLRIGTILPRGNRIRNEYGERRLPRTITRGVGSEEATEVTVEYDGDGLLMEQRDGRNLKTEFSHDAFGRLIESWDFDEQDQLYHRIRQDYDKAGNLILERLFDPDGSGGFRLLFHSQHIYNELGQRIETRVRSFQLPLSYTAADVTRDDRVDDVPIDEAVRTLFFYDEARRLIRIEEHGRRIEADGRSSATPAILAFTYQYNAVGWLISEKDPLGNETKTHYDKHGLVTRMDVHEQVAGSQSGKEVFTTLYAYDGLDRLVSLTDSLGNVTQYAYDSRDAVVGQTDPLGNVARFEYDIYGRQVASRIEMTDTGLGGGQRQPNSDIVTRYEYDANDNLIRLIDAHGTPTNQNYDALDRRFESRYADGTLTQSRYDGNDNVVWKKDNNGLIETTTYDPLDNPLRIDVDNSELQPTLLVEGETFAAFEYDALGQMTRAKNDWTNLRFKVDSLGRVYEESMVLTGEARAFTLKRDYDELGFLSRLTYPSGRVISYEADVLNRIVRSRNHVNGAYYPGNKNLAEHRLLVENQYRGLRLSRKSYGNGASSAFTYDGAGRVIEILHTDSQQNNLLTLQHLYDAAGNMRFKYEYTPGNDYGEVYKYDSRYQLTHNEGIAPPAQLTLGVMAPAQAEPPDNPQLAGQGKINAYLGSLAQVPNDFTFKYDKLGNRLEERHPNQQPVHYTANNLNQYTQREATQYHYYPGGSLRQEHDGIARDYVYNHRNQIVRATEGADLAQFRYDALGRRIWENASGTETYLLYDNENLIEEWRPAIPLQPLLAQYVYEDEIDSRCQLAAGDAEYWFHKDMVGSTRLLTFADGANSIFYRYTPFGTWNLGVPIPALPNTFLYAGRRYDAALDTYDFRARIYSPERGVFLQRDPEGAVDGLNLYGYVRNNPSTRIDPEGRQSDEYLEMLQRMEQKSFSSSYLAQGNGAKAVSNLAIASKSIISFAATMEQGAELGSRNGRSLNQFNTYSRVDQVAMQKAQNALGFGIGETNPGRRMRYETSRLRPTQRSLIRSIEVACSIECARNVTLTTGSSASWGPFPIPNNSIQAMEIATIRRWSFLPAGLSTISGGFTVAASLGQNDKSTQIAGLSLGGAEIVGAGLYVYGSRRLGISEASGSALMRAGSGIMSVSGGAGMSVFSAYSMRNNIQKGKAVGAARDAAFLFSGASIAAHGVLNLVGRAGASRLLGMLGASAAGVGMFLQMGDPDFWKQEFEMAKFNQRIRNKSGISLSHRRALWGDRVPYWNP